jgi:hypothetical protein
MNIFGRLRRWLTPPQVQPIFRDALRVSFYPEDPYISAVLGKISTALKDVPERYSQPNLICIEVSQNLDEAMRHQEILRAQYMERTESIAEIMTADYSLFGYRVKVHASVDDLIDGTWRIVVDEKTP